MQRPNYTTRNSLKILFFSSVDPLMCCENQWSVFISLFRMHVDVSNKERTSMACNMKEKNAFFTAIRHHHS